MLDLAGFRAMFPEFAATSDSLINLSLDDAALRVSPGVYGGNINRAHGLVTADMLVSAPWGAGARLNPKAVDGKTVYNMALKRLIEERGGLRGICP
jgi:hypothetical protein